MIVAGFGFRSGASCDSLADALAKAAEGHKPEAYATVAEKIEGLRDLSGQTGAALVPISPEALKSVDTPTRSQASLAAHGVGSVAEASALAAAGPGARLLSRRKISSDRLATCALAIGGPR